MGVVEQLPRVISGDTHLEIDSKMWLARIPERHRDRAPRVVRTPEGGDAWMVEGAPLQDMVFSLYAGKGRDTWAPFQQRYEGPVSFAERFRYWQELSDGHA